MSLSAAGALRLAKPATQSRWQGHVTAGGRHRSPLATSYLNGGSVMAAASGNATRDARRAGPICHRMLVGADPDLAGVFAANDDLG